MSCVWNLSLQDPIDPDPGDKCPGPSGNVTQYQIRFQTGSSSINFTVNTTMCKARTCNYTFEPPLNPPSSYDRVSVAAENVVGMGMERDLTTQPISELSVISFISTSISHLFFIQLQWISMSLGVHMCHVYITNTKNTK